MDLSAIFNALCAIPSSGVISSPLRLTLNELVNVNLLISFKKPIYWLFINSGRLSSLPGLFWTPSLPRMAPAAHIAIDKFFQRI